MQKLKSIWAEVKEWGSMLSIQLAALVGLISGIVTENPEMIVGLLGVIPVDPAERLLLAIGVGALVFLVPVVARIWPQDKAIPVEKGEANGD